MKALTRLGISLIIAPLACLYAQLAAAQVKIQPANFGSNVVVQPTTEIRLKLDRLSTPEEGRLAIFIGRTDVTSQFRLVGTELVYQSSLFPLPPGETKVTVYLVKGNDWQELTQLPLKVTLQTITLQTQPESGQPEPVQAEPEPPLAEPVDQPSPATLEQPGTSKPEPEKPDAVKQPQSEQPSEEQPQKPPELIQPQPSTSAADLSNSFKPQLPQEQKQPTQPEPIQAKPGTPASDLTSSFKPRMNLTVKSQFLEQRSGSAEAAERPSFTDTTIETGFDAEITRGTFNLQSRFSLLGVTFQPEALRFGELGEAAPNFDLSEYQINAKWGPVQFSMGHLCYGNHPFLFNNVCSRGMILKTNFGERVDLSVNSMNATSIVGFDNFTGLSDFNNTITAATLGFQLLKNEFGGIRLEATVMDGNRQPVGDFNEGEVVDAEKSRGFGFRVFGSDRSGRLRMDVGYARSTFTNPPDPQLTDAGGGAEALLADEFAEVPQVDEPIAEEPITEVPINPPLDPSIPETPKEPVVAEPNTEAVGAQELKIVPVKPVTKSAFYADFSYDLLKDVKLGGHPLSLTLNARHERVDPQFQTIGATITADQLRTLIGMNVSIAGATIQFQQEWSEDNLANVPTVLKTKTRNTSLNVNIPLQTVIGSTNQFLPTLSYSYQRVRQFGANFPIPDLSGFDETEIPNQINQQHQAGVQWTFDELSLGYQFSSSFQDNRQLSRETADFLNFNHQLSLSWQPSPRFQLTLGYNWSSAESKEAGITRFNTSPTLGLSWELIKDVTFAMNYNTTSDRDSLNQTLTQATGLEAILTWRFILNVGSGSSIPGSAFIRYSRQSNLNRDNVFGLSTDSTIQVINAGLSVSF